jgi:hypothetical protein
MYLFKFSLIFCRFSKICRHMPVLVKIRREQLPPYVKTYTHFYACDWVGNPQATLIVMVTLVTMVTWGIHTHSNNCSYWRRSQMSEVKCCDTREPCVRFLILFVAYVATSVMQQVVYRVIGLYLLSNSDFERIWKEAAVSKGTVASFALWTEEKHHVGKAVCSPRFKSGSSRTRTGTAEK